MYPRTLAESDRIRKSEVKFYDAVRDGLPDEWEAFHSVGWVARDHAEGSEHGEIDMVRVHPDEGVLCAEVKGEGVECIGPPIRLPASFRQYKLCQNRVTGSD